MDRVVERHQMNRSIRQFFEAREFLEVETPALVPSPGTDVYIDPIAVPISVGSATVTKFLHTSPEFAMKRLVAQGYERIYQLCKTFRDGEQTDVHSPEFTILEWYRSGAEMEEIVDDVEDLCRELLPDVVEVYRRRVHLSGLWTRVSMQDLVQSVCGFDILECAERDELHEQIERSVGVNPRAQESWDDLFFDLWVRFIDPVLQKMGVVFVCDWPQRLAVLSEPNPDDPRTARRFELFIGGLEIANGFQELTDAAEQERRFRSDNETRKHQKRPSIPIPEHFLDVLKRGFPRSAGVAVGVDRLLMLRGGASTISDVLNSP